MSKSKTKVAIVAIVAAVLAAALYFSFHYSKNGATGTSSERTTVTLAQAANTLLYLPLYVAIDKGYLNQRRITVNVITAGGDSQAFAALASGQAQFAQGDPTFAAISAARGGPGIVIASVLNRVAFWGVALNPKIAPFTNPKGFKGMTVVTYPDPNTAYVVQKDLDYQAGLTLGRDTKIIQATFGTELGPLQNGAAQIAVSIEPTVSTAISQGAHIVFSYADAWGPFALTGLMTTKDYAARHPKVVQSMVDAYEQALQLIHNNPTAVLPTAERYFPQVTHVVLRQAINRLVEDKVFPAHAEMSTQSWLAALKLREQIGDLQPGNYQLLNDQQFGIQAIRSVH